MMDSQATTESAADNKAPTGNFADARRAMVNSQLRTSNVNTPAIMRIMDKVPREQFIPENKVAFAYIDRAVALTADRVLNPPVTHGLMLERAAIKASDNVLIIGAGTGYLATLVAPLANIVTALEHDGTLFAALQSNMDSHAKVTAVHADLTTGYKASAPYSLILIDGAVEHIPPAIAAQLADTGRIICGVSDNGVMRLAEGRKSADGNIGLNNYADADVAPLAAFAKAAEYRFA